MARKYIDFVLVWERPSSTSHGVGDDTATVGREDDYVSVSIDSIEAEIHSRRKNETKKFDHDNEILEKREIFEKNLEEEGLILEREAVEGSKLNFVKIIATTEVLRRYAEILRLRMPMKKMEEEEEEPLQETTEAKAESNSGLEEYLRRGQRSKFSRLSTWFHKKFDYDKCLFPPLHQHLTAIYSRDKDYLFDVDNKDFFSQSMRTTIVDFIIRRKRFSDNAHDDFAFGIERLIHDKVYCSAYPLHDGDLKSPGGQRQLLYEHWASLSLRKCFKMQPLDHVKEYFGVNVGLYFAWLGYYTRMLIPASILGFICILYGLGTVGSDEYSSKVCNDGDTHTMCPMCSHFCQYWKLSTTCLFSRFTYIFDNYATIVFAVLMSFWAAIFLEFWKRYSAQITHKWDLSTFDLTEEQPRLEFLSRLKRLNKLNTDEMDTNTNKEPHVSFWKTRVPIQLFSLGAVLFLVALASAVILGVIAYRVTMVPIFNHMYPELQGRTMMLVSASAAAINLMIIVIFNVIYRSVAQYFTEIELHRTQTEFDDALTLKIFSLQFVNYYSSIFYIAFFKGRFATPPNVHANIFRQEKCGTAGCMTDLCIQLAIIMVGKQFMGGVLEMTTPVIQKWVKQLKLTVTAKRKKTRKAAFSTQWAKDYKLAAWHSRSLFNEYLEMIIQYGFVTIFVAAFPLAPFFALINNILEMRLDATKMLRYSRRPVGQRVNSIGVWYGILDTISRVAVISNAFIIAFTSNFVPKLMYYWVQEGDDDMDDIPFFENSLVSFNVTDFDPKVRPRYPAIENSPAQILYNKTRDEGICWYQGFTNNHTHTRRYKNSNFYWQVVAARLVFVLLFQNFVSVCVLILKVLIPDVPKKLQQQIRHENHLTSEIIIKQEMLRARQETQGQVQAEPDHLASPAPIHSPAPAVTEEPQPTPAPEHKTIEARSEPVVRKPSIWGRCVGVTGRSSDEEPESSTRV